MRSLVVLVSVMSFLIVMCLGLIAYGFASKQGSQKMAETPALILPQGARVIQIAAYKSDLALLVNEKTGTAIYIVNPKTGKTVMHMPVEMTGTFTRPQP